MREILLKSFEICFSQFFLRSKIFDSKREFDKIIDVYEYTIYLQNFGYELRQIIEYRYTNRKISRMERIILK